MASVSLYRNWRPETFAEVVGQDNIVKALENSLENRRISHAYLFTGPRGTGKTSVARILAKGLNCQLGPTSAPCGTCEECARIKTSTSLNVVEIDGASNRGIDDVRELRSQVQFTPINASYKVYIIDEVHMLTTEAFNALLKTLEEPPKHVVFIFATTDPHRLPPTILSRVQRYDFVRFSEQAIVDRLSVVAQGARIEVEPEALPLIAQHAAGGMRDALGILEKCAAFATPVTADAVAEVLGVAPQEQVDLFARHIVVNAKLEALQIIDDLYNQGRDLNQFALTVIAKLRQEILEKTMQNEQAGLFAIQQLSETVREMRFAPDPRISLELAVFKIATPKKTDSRSSDLDQLEGKVRALEKQIAKLQTQVSRPKEGESAAASTAKTVKKQNPSANDEEGSAFVIEIWSDYLKGLRDERLMQCEAFLKEGTPIGLEDGHVVLAFPRDRGFHKASIEQDSHRDPAERVLSKLMGKQIRFKCVYQDEVASVPKAQTSDRSPAGKKKMQEESKLKESDIEGDNLKSEAAFRSEEGSKPEDIAAEDFLKASMETFGGRIIAKPKER